MRQAHPSTASRRSRPPAPATSRGLITSAVPAGDLDTAVASLVAQLFAGAPRAVAAAKRLVYEVPAMPRDAAFAGTTEVSQGLLASDEAAEGVAAFREKRAASWVPYGSPGSVGGS